MATDAASPEEVLPAPPEVDASSDDRVDAGVTANPGESVAEVTLPRAEVEAPEAGQSRQWRSASRPGTGVATPAAEPIGAPSEAAKLGARRAGAQ